MIKVFVGNEPYIIDFKVNDIKKDRNAFLITECGQWSDEILDNLDATLLGQPMYIINGDLPTTDKFLKFVEKEKNGDYDLIFVPDKADKRTKIYKLLDSKGYLTSCNKLPTNRVVTFINQVVKNMNVTIERETAESLITRAGYYDDDAVSLYTLEILVRKLCFSCNDNHITMELVMTEIDKNINGAVYELFNYLVSKEMQKFIELYKELSRKENAIGIMSCMLRSARLGFKATLEPSKNIAKEIGVNPAALSFARKLKNSDASRLVDIFQTGINELKNGYDTDATVYRTILQAHYILS